ncbi:hypothetical protein D3C87_1836490 [compost metagenome]
MVDSSEPGENCNKFCATLATRISPVVLTFNTSPRYEGLVMLFGNLKSNLSAKVNVPVSSISSMASLPMSTPLTKPMLAKILVEPTV